MSLNNQFKLPTAHSTLTFTANATERIDKYISRMATDYSRTFLQHLITQGQATLNGKLVTKGSTLVQPFDRITITILPTSQPLTQHIDPLKLPAIEVLHTHEQFLIVAKPAHVIVHKSHTQDTQATLVDWLAHNFQETTAVGSLERPGIVHRLDKDTSGLLIIARTNYAHKHFNALFKERAITKTYLALVHGHAPQQGVVELPIGRHPVARHKMTTFTGQLAHASHTARSATTHYRVIEYFDAYSLLEVKPVTGRTHQIRVHCAAIGHPIVGDAIYGKTSPLIARQALHAQSLQFLFNGESFLVTAPVPADLTQVISQLRQ